MKEVTSPAIITRFNLGSLPMGFGSATPWRIVAETRPEPAAAAALDPSAETCLDADARAKANPRTRWAALAVFALLSLYAFLSWTASLKKGQSFDEGLQLAVGYNLWLNRDFRMEGANGDFVKRWATLPFLLSQPHFVDRQDRFWKMGAPYELAHRFFFQLGNVPETLLAQARAMVVVLGVATGLLVFCWARELFGTAGGLVSLTLFVFSPHMLAFGGIVSTDMSITFLLLASTWFIWRLLEGVTIGRLVSSTTTFGLLVLAKPSALVILPITAVLIALRLWKGKPLWFRWSSNRTGAWKQRRHQVLAISGMIVAHAIAGWGAIWAQYSFRYAASPMPADPALSSIRQEYRDGMAGPLRALLEWMRESHIVPEGFHRGVRLLANNDDETVSFMAGEWEVGGRPMFFPYAIWAKTSPLLFILLVAGLAIWWSTRLRHRASPIPAPSQLAAAPPSLYYLFPLIALIACYLGVALTEDLNIGHRHILPIYPAIYILAGSVGLLYAARRTWWKHSAMLGILVWAAGDSFAVRPDYLAYFGPQAGGPEEGYKHLADSSIDWGMDLPALKEVLDREDPNHVAPLFLAYFGTDSPQYHGLKATRLPGFFDRRPITVYPFSPGYYAISATLLQSLYTVAVGPWSHAYESRYRLSLQRIRKFESTIPSWRQWNATKRSKAEIQNLQLEATVYDALRSARLCAWLRNKRAPDFHAGHSILVWKLTKEDLETALFGPPVELTDDPLPERHYGRHMAVRG